jgi:hypothetical protein
MGEYVKIELSLPPRAKTVLYDGKWMTFAEWADTKTPSLDVKRKLFFIFSSKFLSMEKAGRFSFYLIELTEFNNVSIITDFHYLNHALREVPFRDEATKAILDNPLISDIPLTNTYYFSAVEDHHTLLENINKVLTGNNFGFPLQRNYANH